MHFFSSKDEQNASETVRKKLYLADCLIRDIDKALEDRSSNNLPNIKSAIFDIVVLEKVLAKIGFACELEGELKQIRNSLAHVDERLEKFNFQPVEINGFKASHERSGDQFKTSLTLNFQGAIDSAQPKIPVGGGDTSVKVTSLFGMLDDEFLWVDNSGKQRFTNLDTIKNGYQALLKDLRNARDETN